MAIKTIRIIQIIQIIQIIIIKIVMKIINKMKIQNQKSKIMKNKTN